MVLAVHPLVADWNNYLRCCRYLSNESFQETLPEDVLWLFKHISIHSSRGERYCLAPGGALWSVLHWLLLGIDARHIWNRRKEHDVDGCTYRNSDMREKYATLPAHTLCHRYSPSPSRYWNDLVLSIILKNDKTVCPEIGREKWSRATRGIKCLPHKLWPLHPCHPERSEGSLLHVKWPLHLY